MRTIVEERSQNLVVMDVFSKLIQERIIFIDSVITANLANEIIAQLLILDADSNKPINIYINSPGGSVSNGLAIYDVAMNIKSPIRTICVGIAASMAAILMLMGKERCALKHSKIMMHEVSSEVEGKTKDIEVDFKRHKDYQHSLYEIVKEKTKITDPEEAFKLDRWYSAEEAKEVGFITSII